jgi:hypothetical protein
MNTTTKNVFTWRYLWVIALASLPTYLFETSKLFPNSPTRIMMEPNVPLNWVYLNGLLHALPILAVLICSSKQLGRPAAGWWSASVFLGCLAIVYLNADPGAPVSFARFLTHKVLLGVPFIVWGALHLRDKRAWPFVFFMAWGPAMSAIMSGSSLFLGFRFASMELISEDGGIYHISFLAHIHLFINPVLLYVLLVSMYRQALKSWRMFQPRLLELGGYVSKGQALLLFLSFKVAILFSAVGMMQFLGLLHTDFGRMMEGNYAFSPAMTWINAIASLLFLWVVLYLYRKFLLEYFFQLGQKPAYLYWFLQAPGLDVILFIHVLILISSKSQPIPYETFYKSQESSSARYIRVFLVIAQLLVGLAALLMHGKNKDSLALMSSLAGVGLAITAFYYRPAVGVLFVLLFLQFYGLSEAEELRRLDQGLWPDTLWNSYFGAVLGFSAFFMMMGVLHIGDFSSDEPENISPETSGVSDAPL